MCRPPYCQLRFCLTLIAVGSLRLDAHADGRQTERGVGRMVDGLRLHGTGDDGLDVEGSQERLSERGRRSKRDGVVDHLAFEAATEVMLRNKAGRKDLSSGSRTSQRSRQSDGGVKIHTYCANERQEAPEALSPKPCCVPRRSKQPRSTAPTPRIPRTFGEGRACRDIRGARRTRSAARHRPRHSYDRGSAVL